MQSVDRIPVAHTPDGGYRGSMPPPVLAGCADPLAAEVPDLRGTWQAVEVWIGTERAPDDHPLRRHVERIEQCADRVVITAGGVIHDMRADGTLEHGVDDVAAIDHRTRIQVVATFEGGALVLRPVGLPGVEVVRRRDGATLLWTYHAAFTVRLARMPE